MRIGGRQEPVGKLAVPPAPTDVDRGRMPWLRRLRPTLSKKIPFLVAVAALAAGAVVAVADYRHAATELSHSAEKVVTSLLYARRVAIVDYLASLRRDLKMQAASPFVIDAFNGLKSGWDWLGPDAKTQLRRLYIENNPYPPAGRKQLDHANDSSGYSVAHARFHPRLRDFVEQYGYRDLLLVDISGNVIYSVMKQADFATLLKFNGDTGDGLALAFRQVASRAFYGIETFVDFSFYEPAGGRAVGFVGRPLFDDAGTPIGVILFEIPAERIHRVMKADSGFGETGETFIVGRDLLMRNEARFSPKPTVLARRMDSDAVKAALEGRSGVTTVTGVGNDGEEEQFLSAYAPLDFLGTRWAIVARANLAELRGPVRRMRNRAILNVMLLALSVAAIGYVLTRMTVVDPLRRMAGAVRRMSAGDREIDIPPAGRGDEIGDIARALTQLRNSLVEQVKDSAEQEEEAKAEAVRRRLAEAIEAISDGFILIDPDGRVVLANSKYREIYRRSAHLLWPGADFSAFLRHHAEIGEIVGVQGRVEEFLADRARRMKSGDTVESRLADGRWLLTSDFQTEDGGTVSVCSDITDLKRREHALADSEERYRLLVDMLPDGVLLHDVQAMRFLNAAGRGILEIPDEVLIDNLHYLDFVHDAEKRDARSRIREFIRLTGDSPLTERRIRTYRGREIVIEIAAVPFRRGESEYALAVFRDITDRKLTEMRLREREGQVRAIVEAAADAIVMLDEDDRIVDFNPAAERIFGFGRDAVQGKRMAKTLIAPAHRAAHSRSLRAAAKGRDAIVAGRRRDIEAIRHDGEVFPAELTVTQVSVEGRRLFAAFLRDLTETRRAQAEIERQREALYQSEKLTALGSLLAGVAHELNNPLSVVVAQAMLMEETAQDEKVIRRSVAIRSAAERCSRIVKTFLAMARQQTPEQGTVHLNDLVENGLELLAYTLRTAGIDVVKDLDPDLPAVWGDADQLHQVVANLVINAQHAMMETPEPRRLSIATGVEASTGMVMLTVDDTGPGVPAEMRLRIFDPFFTTKPTGIGTGIGLSVCHGVVESHGGQIGVEESPEGGARFLVRLPPGGDAAAAVDAVPIHAPAARDSHRILVVDDEEDIASALADILTLDGHSVDTADSGLAALERIAQSDYDLILTDLRMPKMDGPALYRQLKERYPHLSDRVIVLTGDTLHASASGFLTESGLPMIEKPFVPSEVLRLVAERLSRAAE